MRFARVLPALRAATDAGRLLGQGLPQLAEVADGEPATQEAIEEAVLDLLERDLESPALERMA